ncbi:hypothetical protein E2I00_007055, partial [Balaenoptera physalus]
LISEVKVQVENQIKGIYFNITAICPDGSRKPGTDGCGNVTSNDEVLFNVTVTMEKCDVMEGKSYAIIKPIGFNETTKIHIHRNCSCQCDDSRGPKRKCVEETFLDAKCFQCDENKCHFDEDQFPSESCKSHKDQPACSGRGVCICGKCLCHKIKLGKVYGKYCEKDDFSCPYHHGNLCAGEYKTYYRLQPFKKLNVFTSVSPYRNCVQCLHPHNLSQAILDRCKTSCTLKEQHYVDQTS